MGKTMKNQKQLEQQQKKSRRIRLFAGILLILAAAALVIGGILLFQKEKSADEAVPDASGYEDTLSAYYSAIVSADGKTMSQLMAPPEYWTYYLETYDKTEEEVIENFAEGCNNTMSEWQSEYGTDVKVSYQIAGMSQQGQEGLDEWNSDMKELLGNDGASVSEAVTLEVDLTFTGSAKTGSNVVYPTLGKIGEKWYIISEDSEELKGGSSQQ
ncbi:hypothetical protein [Ruminococcus sp.]|uniref:hypothetical protein n=1 Tax=Ruminococcus sp. TaxID=41978 RepID=UPI0025DCC3C5|nr:hypothetical protein [Ruminococcus sp.]